MITQNNSQGNKYPTRHIDESNAYIQSVPSFPKILPGFIKENGGVIHEEIAAFVKSVDPNAYISFKVREGHLGKKYPLERTLYLSPEYEEIVFNAFQGRETSKNLYVAHFIPDYAQIKNILEQRQDSKSIYIAQFITDHIQKLLNVPNQSESLYTIENGRLVSTTNIEYLCLDATIVTPQ